MLKIIKSLGDEIRNIILVSPTAEQQDAQNLFKGKRLWIVRNLKKNTFRTLLDKISQHRKHNGDEHFLIVIDDNTGNKALHGGRISQFGNLCAISRHWNCSIICIAHQGKSVSPTFRNNVTGLIAFPAIESTEIKFICDEFGNPLVYSPSLFRAMLDYVWRGGREDHSEWGQHFLYVHKPPRRMTEYSLDFQKKIKPDED